MIPLRDLNPRHSFPWVTLALIAANAAVFFHQMSQPPAALRQMVLTWGFVPARLEAALADPAAGLLPVAVTLVSSMFLHGSFWHILGNMWFLWVFGDNVEDRLGHGRYLVFYLLCGAGAGLAHGLFVPGSAVPAVGASGAISGVLGAYLVMFPRARVVTLVPLVIFFFLARLPAVVLLGWWFLLQLASGLAELGAATGAGVAWWAHIGGFVIGVALTPLLRRRSRTFIHR
jgi:membrane associated rhomboid family serine protease